MSAGFIYFLNKDLLKSQTFNSNGTFTPPPGVNHVFVLGAGGGGGGEGSSTGSAQNYGTAGFGGNGSQPTLVITAVTPGVPVNVTIGLGGAGGAPLNPGANGGDSLFGSIRFFGGLGADRDRLSFRAGDLIIQNSAFQVYGAFAVGVGEVSYDLSLSQIAKRSMFAAGGANGSGVGGYGGGGGFGTGGAGGAGIPPATGNGNPGLNGGVSAGGGGASPGYNPLGNGANGGNGGNGRIIVYYVEGE